MRRLVLTVALCLWASASGGATVTDATGRAVAVPDQVRRVLPAGPPAAVLLAALAPDLLVGWPRALSAAQAALLPPAVARLPSVPVLTGPTDATGAVAPLHPDLILDYGTVSPRYVGLDEALQAHTGVPSLLFDGTLRAVPQTLRTLGRLLHREKRAEELARAAERVLARRRGGAGLRVVYAEGADARLLAAPGSETARTLGLLGWTLLAPAGDGAVRHIDGPAAIDRLDPDLVLFADPAARATVSASPTWQSVRAVRDGHAFVVPNLPFGWFGHPPSINRLLGIAAFSGGARPDVGSACLWLATMTGRMPSIETVAAFTAGLRPVGAERE